LVIDVSGDGVQNSGADTWDARDAARASGITTINGLAIGPAGILTFYQNNIIAGAGAFAIGVNDFDDFAAAVQTKIEREITPGPSTGTAAGFARAHRTHAGGVCGCATRRILATFRDCVCRG
jgi:Protein of unknown function (DUF1194)